jgi:hypothetical protein
MSEAAAAESAPMKTFTSATETAAAKPAAAVESAAAKTSGISMIEKEREPHQSCGQNGRHKELET